MVTGLMARGQLYIFDVKDPTSFSYDCGTTTGSYWGVKNNHCKMETTPVLINSGCSIDSNINVPVNVRINQTGALPCTDTAWVHYTIDSGATWIPLDTIIGCEQTANTLYTYHPEIPNNSTFSLRVTFESSSNTDFWQIQDGDIVIDDPCMLLPTGWITVDAEALPEGNRIEVAFQYAAEEIQNLWIERSEEGHSFTPLLDIPARPLGEKMWEMWDRNPPTGVNYYRIRILHRDGTLSSSAIFSLKTANAPPNWSIYPNPAQEEIRIDLSQHPNTTVTIALMNLMGQRVKSLFWPADKRRSTILSLNDIQPGQYLLQMSFSGTVQHQKLVIQ